MNKKSLSKKECYFNKTEVYDFTKKVLDSMTGPEKPIDQYEIEAKTECQKEETLCVNVQIVPHISVNSITVPIELNNNDSEDTVS